MVAFWLVEDYVISCDSHPEQEHDGENKMHLLIVIILRQKIATANAPTSA